MLHGKTMVVDGKWGIVGSANVDIRSFRLNFEIGAIIADQDIAKILEDKFNVDIANSEQITSAHISRRRFLQKLRYGTARLLSPLL
jgi:cardiolipin synthase A/B